MPLANASSASLRSALAWFGVRMLAAPFLHDSFIHYFTPVYPDANQPLPHGPFCGSPPGSSSASTARFSTQRCRAWGSLRQGLLNSSTPESWISERQRPIRPAVVRSSFLPLLITEHSPLNWLVVTHDMRTQEPTRAVIPCRNRPVLNRRHSHKAVHLPWRLFSSRARTTHLHSGYSPPAQRLRTGYFITQ
jgi:hypothetical protein